MLRVGTDHHNTAFAFDDLAFFANRFDGRSYFHLKYLLTDTIPVITSLYLERHVMRPLVRS